MNGLQVVERARSQLSLGTVYKLGKGGFMPQRDTAHDTKMQCDCTGFVSWCLGVSRKTDNPYYRDQNGGWIETSAIVRDCRSTFGFFDFAPFPLPGMVIVFGDRDGHQGHAGIVTEVHDSGVARVVHCSSGNFRSFGDAIQETDPVVFMKNGSVVARCAFIEYGDAIA